MVLESAQRRSRRIADQVLYINPDKFLILANNHILKALVVYLLHLMKKPDFLFDQWRISLTTESLQEQTGGGH